MRGLLVLASVTLFGASVVACSVPEGSLPGDSGDEMGSTTSHASKGCSASRAELVANAGPERGAAIERGFAWLDKNVPYSQTAQHEGYRTDCSGFVSMCWSLPQSYTTADFAAGTAKNEILGSYEDLQPGDGLVRRSGGSGHAVLFVGWDDDAHTTACVLEESNSANDMQFGIRAVSSLKGQGYKAMRADGMPDATPAAVADEPIALGDEEEPIGLGTDDGLGADDGLGDDGLGIDDGALDPEPPPALPIEGDVCAVDETCNPWVSLGGTGLVCGAAGTCIPGCRIDLQCPGALLCKSGKCSM